MNQNEEKYLKLLKTMKKNKVNTLSKTINDILIYEERYSVEFVDAVIQLKKIQ